jgi:nucleoside-diphosphate-sugar epimerase
LTNGRVCIVGCADVTGDGRVTVRDVVRLFVRILRASPYDPAFDLNADGEVTITDLRLALGQLGQTC